MVKVTCCTTLYLGTTLQPVQGQGYKQCCAVITNQNWHETPIICNTNSPQLVTSVGPLVLWLVAVNVFHRCAWLSPYHHQTMYTMHQFEVFCFSCVFTIIITTIYTSMQAYNIREGKVFLNFQIALSGTALDPTAGHIYFNWPSFMWQVQLQAYL